MRHAYSSSLRTTTEDKILETIPDHYFWDIKAPQINCGTLRKNKYNPFRGREYENFFDMRAQEEFMKRQTYKDNLNDSVSTYRRY